MTVPHYILLNPGDIHREGDEMFSLMEHQWIPVKSIHFGDPVWPDSAPCRRLIDPRSANNYGTGSTCDTGISPFVAPVGQIHARQNQ